MHFFTSRLRLFFTGNLVLGALLGASCSVDTSKFIFDDDAFDDLSDGEGGEGGDDGEGGQGGSDPGEGGSGGATKPEPACISSVLSCDGRQVEVCVGGAKIPVGAPCEFACSDGQCIGVCLPETTSCVSDTEVQTCDQTGTWESSFCEFACTGDACGGSCRPGTVRCGGPDGLDIEACDAAGEWVSTGTTCGGACTAGQCTGTCSNGDAQCVPGMDGPAALTCDGGSWENGTLEQCEFSCQQGECTGVCEPASKRCVAGNNSEPIAQTCGPDGEWITPGVQCDFICQDGACRGECKPGESRCDGDRLLVCDSEKAVWVTEQDCAEKSLLCVGYEDKRWCGECNPPPKGQSQPPSCYFNSPAICTEEGTWKADEECDAGGDKVCVGSGMCTFFEKACTLGLAQGCLGPEKGWFCEKLNGTPEVVGCDCSNGIACKN